MQDVVDAKGDVGKFGLSVSVQFYSRRIVAVVFPRLADFVSNGLDLICWLPFGFNDTNSFTLNAKYIIFI